MLTHVTGKALGRIRVTLPEAVDRAVRRLALKEFGDRAPYLKSFVIKHDGDSVGWLTTAARELRRAVMHWPQRLIERYPDLIRRKLADERRIYFTRYNPDSINFHTLDLKREAILGFVVHQFTHWIEAERGKRRLAVIATGYFPPNPPLKPDALNWAGAEGQRFVREHGDLVSTDEKLASLRPTDRVALVTLEGRTERLEVAEVEDVQELVSIVVAPEGQGKRPGFEYARAVDEMTLAGDGALVAQHFLEEDYKIIRRRTPMPELEEERERARKRPILLMDVRAYAEDADNRTEFIGYLREFAERFNVTLSQVFAEPFAGLGVAASDDGAGLQLTLNKDECLDRKAATKFVQTINEKLTERFGALAQQVTGLRTENQSLMESRRRLVLDSTESVIGPWMSKLDLNEGERRIFTARWESFKATLPQADDAAKALEGFKTTFEADLKLIRDSLPPQKPAAPPPSDLSVTQPDKYGNRPDANGERVTVPLEFPAGTGVSELLSNI